MYVPDGRDSATLTDLVPSISGADPINTTAVIRVSKLGSWTVGLLMTDGCFNVTLEVNATASCAAPAPLPVLNVRGSNGPLNFTMFSPGADPSVNAGSYNRALTLWFSGATQGSPMIRSGDNMSWWNFSDWTLISHTCPPEVIGNPSGLMQLPLSPVLDATNAVSAAGGQCRFDADPPSFPARLAAIGVSNTTWDFVGVGNYTLQYRVYDGCNVVPIQQVVQASTPLAHRDGVGCVRLSRVQHSSRYTVVCSWIPGYVPSGPRSFRDCVGVVCANCFTRSIYTTQLCR